MTMTTDADPKSINAVTMLLLAFLVGIIGGIGAIIFRGLIGFFHNLLFFGHFSIDYNANIHPAVSTWGIFVIFVPVVGSFLVTWLIETFAPEARGHGVPEVIDAIYFKEGKIRPVVAIVKAIASAVSIGSGGSVGREGPIIQIGSAFGSTLGQIVRMPTRQRIILIAAGTGAGIAATFNAPIGGLAFAVELMLVSISAASVSLVAVATVTATFIGRWYLGTLPSFDVPALALPALHAANPIVLSLFLPFGILIGVLAALFIKSIYWFEDLFEHFLKNPYLRHMIGMLLLGIMLYLFMRYSGHYYVDGVGYSTIFDILRGVLGNPWFLLLLFAMKLLATSLTLGSGASGGVFSPALFLGATVGSAFGNVLNYFIPALGVDPIVFAVSGMAAMVGGSTGAVITAVTMIFEQTRMYAAILPMMLTVSLAYAVRIRITKESIYTLKLVRRGMGIAQGLQAAISSAWTAKDVMARELEIMSADELSNWASTTHTTALPQHLLVEKDGEVIGLVKEDLRYMMQDLEYDDLLDPNYLLVGESTRWYVVLRALRAKGRDYALVTRTAKSLKRENIVGVITTREIANAATRSAELLGE